MFTRIALTTRAVWSVFSFLFALLGLAYLVARWS